MDLPTAESAGVFFTATAPRPSAMLEGTEGVSPQLQKLIQQLEELDKGLAAAENDEAVIRRIHTQRTELLRQLVQVTSGSDRDMWLLQLVDSAVASTQSTEGTTDSETLTKLVTEVKASTENKEIISQARFVALTAEYSASLLEPNADYAAIQTKWIGDLEAFVQEFGETRAAADAMLQLAISHEFAGQDEKAISGYERIVQEFPETEMAEKAKGRTRRLQSVGKPLELQRKRTRWPTVRSRIPTRQPDRRSVLGHLVRTVQGGHEAAAQPARPVRTSKICRGGRQPGQPARKRHSVTCGPNGWVGPNSTNPGDSRADWPNRWASSPYP